MGKERKKGRESNPNKAGMYFSLVICVIALAIGAFSAINRKNDLYKSGEAVTTKSVVEIGKNETKITKATTTVAETQKDTTTSVNTTTKSTTIATTKSIVANHFTYPVGGTIKKEFDSKKLQYSETYKDWRLHLGVDIAAKKGKDVTAAGKGKVDKVYNDESLGTTVIISHGNGITCYYSGLSSVIVSKGDTVEIGQKLGVIGDIPSEIVESTHIHFAVKKDGNFVDPIETLDLKS